MPAKRKEFFLDLDFRSLEELEKKYFAKKPFIIRFAKRVKNKISSYIK